jgi:hypothetical protein
MSSEKKPELNQVKKRLKGTGSRGKPDKAVVTGMHNEDRAQILILLNERVASRPELSKELGISLTRVRYEVDVLKNMKPPLIEQVGERPVRGTVEKFFRAVKRAYLDDAEWPSVPDSIKGGMRGSLLGILVDDAIAAVKEGTFDSLENAHMSWTPMILDEQGWTDIVAILLRAMEEAIEVKLASAERLIANDAKGTSCTVSILGYPSANENRKAGPSINDDERIKQDEGSRTKTKKASKKKTAPRSAKATGKSSTKKATPRSKRKGANR